MIMQHAIPLTKQALDVVAAMVMGALLLPVMLAFALAIAVLEGRPVLYVSSRRMNAGPPKSLTKFRTMRRNADRIANRDTIPVQGVRFLNLPITSPLYTPIGRVIERLMLTEMPQLLDVLQGRMSIVGNRPLPESVVASLKEEFPHVEDRFLVPCGLTGPIQLVGRDFLSDADRLQIEASYCRAVMNAYSLVLDVRILAYTVLGSVSSRFRFTPAGVLALIDYHSGGPAWVPSNLRNSAPGLPDAIADDTGFRREEAPP
jgi:lipopolysaccharide/colanic/teichoic acid biosynthesis glycosyltransferase